MTRAVVSVSPASFVQRSMWASALRHPSAPLNVMNLAWRVRGALCRQALEGALTNLVERHPTLRARLTMRGGQLMQEVLQSERILVGETPVEGSDIEERFANGVRVLRELGRSKLDIVAGTPLRAHLLPLASNDQLLCLFVHHAMCDGWSSQIIIRDLVSFYEAHVRGRSAALPPLSEQYADVAQAQIRKSESGGYDTEIKYWRTELSELPPQLALPSTVARKGNRDFFARSPTHSEPVEVLVALREVARKTKASTFSVLLSAVAVLMHGHTTSQDLIVGVPTLNRWSRGEMDLVGCATSLLPARIRPHPSLTFAELCVQVHATVRRLLAYGRIPLELILREINASPLGGPVIPVWCQIRQDAPTVQVDSLGLSFSPVLIERGTLLADLDVDMIESASGLLCEFCHRPSLFEADYIRTLMSHFGRILRDVMWDPTLTVDALCLRAAAQPSSG